MKKQKQLLILVTYINVGRQTRTSVLDNITAYQNVLSEHFSEENLSETNILFKHIILPINDNRPTHIECIFPKAEDLTEDVLNKINNCEEGFKKLINKVHETN